MEKKKEKKKLNKLEKFLIGLLIFFAIIFFLLLFIISIEDDGTNTTENNVQVEANTIDTTINNCSIKYLRHEIFTDYDGKKSIYIYYQFTNNSNSNQTFSYLCDTKAFQNGIELDISYFHHNEESKRRELEIKSGVSITVCEDFVLNSMSDVELEIYPLFSISNNPLDSMIIKLK